MSVPLQTRGKLEGQIERPLLGRVTWDPGASGADRILVTPRLSEAHRHAGAFAGVITTEEGRCFSPRSPVVFGAANIDHLAEGDVVAVEPNGNVRTLYRQNSRHNAIFATDQCNSFCVMCSQPPKAIDDRERIQEHLRLIELIDPPPRELGITGGEPTLLGDDFLRIVAAVKERLPGTALHVLSNGRLFYYRKLAERLGETAHPDLMIGVPVYSDVDYLHDHVVQAKGAFRQTVMGLHNLARAGVAVEIRVVLHRLTIGRLESLANFIYRNLTFAAHVAFMGLEPMGFAVSNLQALWAEPDDYRDELDQSVSFLARRGLRVSIYNHQMCLLPPRLWPFARRSISDWKNDYAPVCDDCCVRSECGGFFASNLRRRMPQGLRAIRSEERAGATPASY